MCINAVCTIVSLSCNNHESSKMHCVVCMVCCEACMVCCEACMVCCEVCLVCCVVCAWCIVGYGCAWCVVYSRYTQEDGIFEIRTQSSAAPDTTQSNPLHRKH